MEQKAARVIRGLEKVACHGRTKRVDVAQLRERKEGRTVFESFESCGAAKEKSLWGSDKKQVLHCSKESLGWT